MTPITAEPSALADLLKEEEGILSQPNVDVGPLPHAITDAEPSAAEGRS